MRFGCLAYSDLRRAPIRIAMVALVSACALFEIRALPAQSVTVAHQSPRASYALRGNRSAHQVLSAASTIQFENSIQTSRITFTLKNSVSPQRYTFETMAGGVALFDYDNDGLLDIFFTTGAAIPSLEKNDASYSNRLFRN